MGERVEPHNGDPILHMRGIGKSFGAHRALDQVRFDLIPGEVHVLAGENGAGKSTLIKILTGVHTAYEGAMTLQGKPLRLSSPQDAANKGISVIHQELSLVPSMNVRDNLFLGREMAGPLGWMRFANQRRRSVDVLAKLGLDLDPLQAVDRFPISVQQMIEIAKALLIDARIIVMDEPTSALTEPEVAKLFSIIQDLKQSGCAIVYISHKMEEIYQLADRITVLRDGQYVGTQAAVHLPRHELVRWMVGRDMREFRRSDLPVDNEVRMAVEGFTVPDIEGKPRPAVENVSFSVRKGEILGFAGLQGSGVSDLFLGLFGARPKGVRGKVTIDGNPYSPRSPRHAIRNGMALLTNDRKSTGLVLPMSVAANVTLASVPRFSPGGWLLHGSERQCAAQHRDSFGIRLTSLDQEVGTLSGGNQQKVALAKWLETAPRVLLLDEPTRGVDVGAKQEIYTLMRQWTEAGISILLITTEMQELLLLSHRIMVMHRGGITAEFDRTNATQEAVLHAAMGRTGTHAAV